MRNKTVRLLALILIVGMAVCMLSGCGTGSKSPAASEKGTQSAQVTEALPAQEVQTDLIEEDNAGTVSGLPLTEETVEFDMFNTIIPPLAPYMSDMNQNSVYKEMEKRTNVHINFSNVSAAEGTNSINILVAGGEYPDLFETFDLYSGGSVAGLEQGIIIDLAEHSDIMPNYFALLDSNVEYKARIMTDDGEVPAACGMFSDVVQDNGMVVRSDWLAEVDMDIPVTVEDWHDILTAFKVELGHEETLWISYVGGMRAFALSSAYGVPSPQGTGVADFLFYRMDDTAYYGPMQDGYREYISTLAQWYKEGLVYKDFMTGDSIQYYTGDRLDTFGIYQLPLANFGNVNGEVKAISLPVVNKDDELHFQEVTLAWTGQGPSVSTQCDDVELACRWIDYWYSEDGTFLANWGIEHEAFEYNENGEPQYTDLIMNNPDGLNTSFALNIYAMQFGGYYRDSYRLDSGYTAELLAERDVWNHDRNDNAYNYPGGCTLTQDETSEFNTIYADIATYVSTMTLSFIVGDDDVEADWDTFISTIEGMNIARCLEIKQASLDRYLKKIGA